MPNDLLEGDRERRKQVRLRLRPDLDVAAHKYEGRTYYIVKDPVSLRYYRFKEQEHFLLRLMDGTHTLDDAQKKFEQHYRPDRLTLEDLEGFAQQLLTVGLAHNESPQSGKQLYERRGKRLRREWLGTFTNVLYIKIPVFDPDRLLTAMLPWTRWIFTPWNTIFSVSLMLAALLLVLTHFDQFRDKLPTYQQFFSFQTVAYMWVALGVVKVIHEFGHGLSCKYFGGEVHEMGMLFLCFSPCLYCNVTDSWTMPNKWHRIIISFAGIYVELIIAAIATFVWWNSPSHPFVHNMSLSLVVVCSVSTVVFNGNPLMRFDGYYVLADWLEIPNLRERCNRYLKNLALEHCLGVEVQREQYMALDRRVLFLTYAVVSWVYRWVVTFSILFFLSRFLEPYKLGAVSNLLMMAALGSMVGWPAYRMFENLRKRGRLPDMKPRRVRATATVVGVLLIVFLLVPLPVSRVRDTGLVEVQPQAVGMVFAPADGGILKSVEVQKGIRVEKGIDTLATFHNQELKFALDEAVSQAAIAKVQIDALQEQYDKTADNNLRADIEQQLIKAHGERNRYAKQIPGLEQRVYNLNMKAPRSGIVYGLPQPDDIGKHWNVEEGRPFCSIGEPMQLRVLVPVSPADYRLLKEDLAARRKANSDLAVTIRVMGRGRKTWEGRITHMPEAEAREVPPALTSKHGGPLAFKAGAQPNTYAPFSQQYLIGIDILDPDAAISPGTLAQVKIHCRWRTCAWWVWRTISQTFDLGLM
ncbi:MAG: hypothetical protein JNM56_37925 [Planctomycetia bacterium]|nr:hypothetical protein [Planctomycetia bacterium]